MILITGENGRLDDKLSHAVDGTYHVHVQTRPTFENWGYALCVLLVSVSKV